VVTSPDVIYRAIRTLLAESLTDLCDDSRVMVVTEENVDLNSPFFVQIRPAGGLMGNPRVGTQLVDDRVEVTTWVRKNKDAGGKETQGIAGETTSLFAVLESVRDPLRNSWLDGNLVVPLRQTGHGTPIRDQAATNYIRCRDVWACSYELSNNTVDMVFSSTAPSSVTGIASGGIDTSITLTRQDESGGEANQTFEDAWQGGTASTTFTNTLSGGTAAGFASYMWALVRQSAGEVLFWTDTGAVEFYSDQNAPPSGPTCSTATIGGIVYRQWRSPYATYATSGTFRVRRA